VRDPDRGVHDVFTDIGDDAILCAHDAPGCRGIVMAAIALVLFISLFAFGRQYFGWSDPQDHIQLALFSCFIFGIICGFRIKD
jgi:hypothetical protein